MIGHVHSLSNVTVEIDGAGAATESYVHVVLRVPAGDGQVDIVGRGRYLDRFERRDGTWAIAHRTYVSDLASTQRVEVLDVGGQLPPPRRASPPTSAHATCRTPRTRCSRGWGDERRHDRPLAAAVTPSWTRSIPSSSPIPSRPTTSSKPTAVPPTSTGARASG